MSKIAFIFPGQGAQYTGMGRDFYEQTETGRKVFDQASELLGFSMHDEGIYRTHRNPSGCGGWFKPGRILRIGGGWRYVGRRRNHHRKAERYPHAAGGYAGEGHLGLSECNVGMCNIVCLIIT